MKKSNKKPNKKTKKNNKKIDKKIDKNKNIIIVSIILLIIVVLLLILIPKGSETKTKSEIFRHREEGIVKEEEYKGIKLTNIKMVTEDDYTTFSANATNISDKDITIEKFYIELKNKNGNSIAKLLGFIPEGLKKGETKKITSSAKGKFKNATDKDIVDYTVKASNN